MSVRPNGGDLALIDAGGANLGSVMYALRRIGAAPRLVRDADELGDPERIILPGVGAAAPSMALLRARGLDVALRTSEAPLLGVCVGLQLLFEGSEEGGVDCLGLLPGRVRKLAGALGAAIHVSVKGENTHHMIEACFKCVGRALRQAIRREGSDLPSTKGAL